MAKREVATQYVGSLLGFIWTFIHPMVMIFVFWVVFSVGFKVKPTNDVPFVVWLTAGMAAWFIFADIVNGSAGVIVSNTQLIKRTLFHSQILPVVKTVESGWNVVAGADISAIVDACQRMTNSSPLTRPKVYGDGAASQYILEHLLEWKSRIQRCKRQKV
jgi:ABC-type polysaccharide/polyol phosphate export permease